MADIDEKYYRVLKKKPFNHTIGGVIVWLFLFWPVGFYFLFKNEVGSIKFRTILSLIILYPMGVAVMWQHSVITKITRIILTSLIPLIIIFVFISESIPPSECSCINTRDYVKKNGYTDAAANKLIKCDELYGKEQYGLRWTCE